MEITPRRRRALSTILALVLAIESVSAVAAAAGVNASARRAGAGTTAAPAPAAAAVAAETAAGFTPPRGAGIPDYRLIEAPTPDTGPAATPAAGSEPRPARPAPANAPKAVKAAKPAAPSFRGRNHVWIPELRINRSVAFFSCARSRPPDNRVYRWGCAGTNNVYLMGHAYSVFKPLHDAFVRGRLYKGMKAYYADAKGRIHVYAVRWWRVTLPTPDAKWAWASLSRPSMTLQTCVGKNSRYRLMVRLVEVGR